MAGTVYHRYTITLEVVADPNDGLADPTQADHWFGAFGGAIGDEIASIESIKVDDHGEIEAD